MKSFSKPGSIIMELLPTQEAILVRPAWSGLPRWIKKLTTLSPECKVYTHSSETLLLFTPSITNVGLSGCFVQVKASEIEQKKKHEMYLGLLAGNEFFS